MMKIGEGGNGKKKRKVEKQNPIEIPKRPRMNEANLYQSGQVPLKCPAPVRNVDKNWTVYIFCNLVKSSGRTGNLVYVKIPYIRERLGLESLLNKGHHEGVL